MYYSELLIEILELSAEYTSDDWMLNMFSAAIEIMKSEVN